MMTTTAYSKTFGDKPQAQQDFNVLREKPFVKLESAQVLKPHIQEYMMKFLQKNDQDKFTSRIFFTVREMFTVVKNQLAEVPTS